MNLSESKIVKRQGCFVSDLNTGIWGYLWWCALGYSDRAEGVRGGSSYSLGSLR